LQKTRFYRGKEENLFPLRKLRSKAISGKIIPFRKKLERTEIAQVGATPFLLESTSTKLDPNLQSLSSDSAGAWRKQMVWARLLAHIAGTVNQELLLKNEYLAAENRILRAQIN